MYHPDLLENVSSCKSPQQMFGAVIKTWYAETNGIDPKDIVSVSVMPCTAKKFEVDRDDQAAAGVADVDISITTRELARMIERAAINFKLLPDEAFDNPLGESTGASVIFGATGGVMEAALRTAVETLTGKELDSVDFEAVRGTAPIKEATLNVAGMDVKVAVASGASAAHVLLNRVKNGEQFHFIEIMGCPGGCVNGGGQPHQPASVRSFTDLKALRAAALYQDDASKAIRKSHENPMIKKLYAEYLEKPGSHKAHEILHTSYVDRSKDYIK
jgi:NADP-reducing hydrogenase subunit HndD